MRNSAEHITSLEELFRKLEHQCPSIDSVVPILIKRIVALPPCGADGHQIEMICAELLLAIEDLKVLFPQCLLSKTEALASIATVGLPEQNITPTTMTTVAEWEGMASAGTKTMNKSLFDYLKSLQKMYVDLRMARHMYHEPAPTKNILSFTKKPATDPLSPRPQ